MDATNRNHFGLTFEHGFKLEELRIDPATGEVAGPSGRQTLDPKVMDVLVFMAARTGQVLSRDEFHEQLWPSVVVSDDALTRCIHELRRQLGLAGGNERYKALVETLPKRGYRLNGSVAPLEPEVPIPRPPPARRNWLVAGAAVAGLALILFAAIRGEDPVAPPAATANSIAVLPFLDMSEAQDQGYLADGITEEILNRLTRAGNLRVISRTSSFVFRNQPLDIREVSEKLDVSHVLEGSIRRSGDTVRITAQLIAADDNSHVWSDTYERELGDLFAVQDEIAASVATALQVTLGGNGGCCPPPASPEALELFLQGQFFYSRRSPGDIDRAVDNFEKAVAIDPQYATAWAALAGAYNLLIYDYARPIEKLRPLQRDAALRAVELAPGLAIAHARLGQYYHAVGDRAKGHEHFEKAVALDPNDLLVMGNSADRAFWRGDQEQTVAIWRRIVARNPLSPTDRINLANFLFAADKPAESAAEFRKALELNPDFHGTARLEFAALLATMRRYDEAHAQVLELPEGAPRDQGLALLYQAPGHEAEADAALARLASRPVEPGNTLLAELYAFRGMKEEAIAALIAAHDAVRKAPGSAEHTRVRLRDMQEDMLRSPHFKVLHGDPRWAELTAEPE